MVDWPRSTDATARRPGLPDPTASGVVSGAPNGGPACWWTVGVCGCARRITVTTPHRREYLPMALRDYLVGEVAEDYSDGELTRREALRRLGLLGLSAGAASTLLSACAAAEPAPEAGPAPASPPPAPVEPPGQAQSVGRGQEIRFAGPAGELIGAWAAPTDGEPTGAVLVIHENRGLTEHFYDLVGRLAGAGYGALCVDLLSDQGGTAALADPAQAPTTLADKPEDALVADLRAGIDELGRR